MAFLLTTEPALCSCFRILLQNLAPILRSKDLLSFWDIDDQKLKIFQKNISEVQDFLNSAEERSQEKGVSSWMDDLRELSYNMENLVDEMNRKHVLLDQHVANLNQGRTSHGAADKYSYWDIKLVQFQMKTTEDYCPQVKKTIKEGIDDASARLKEFLVEANRLDLKRQPAGKSPVSSIASRGKEDVGPYVDESDVYGRQKDQDFVIQELLSSSHSSKKYSTVSIVGSGGVGKTTLARLIFNDERVEKNFDGRSWAYVSESFDAEKVVKELICQYVTGDSASTNNAPSALRRGLVDMVKGKKVMIVLDDVWEEEAWDSLKVLFTHCAEGSKILVTTRNKNVENYISNKEGYVLEPLGDEDCWRLFKGVAFGEEVDENLERIGREIVKKCKGVPLAVKVIGSTLRFASKERWENALKNKLWEVEHGERDEIFPALKLSYHHLPSPLKRCFGYLSLFPTDYELKQDKVVRLWIAEGFIESREGRSWEDIGRESYEELKRRCLIQENDMMHDLIHSLACSVFGKFSHHIAKGTNSSMQMGSVRHLSVIGKDMDLGALDENKHLCTLFSFNGYFSEKIFDQRLLRVLNLGGATLQELPSSVKNLKCLRYLDLSWSHKIEYLPDSICELQNLQTLDLEGYNDLRSLPNDIGDLQKLRYLRLESTSLSVLPPSIVKLLDLLVLDLRHCQHLSRIPEDIGNLVSLRELHLAETSISSLPDSICYLKKLRVLNLDGCNSFSNLPDEIGAIQDLSELNLSSTSISHLPKSIGNLRNLRNLHFSYCERLTQLPEVIGNLVSLRELHLADTSISSLPDSICKLKKLRVLNLRDCNSISNLPDEIGALQDLREMNLCGASITHLPKSIGNLRNLRNLNIDGCEKLTRFPEDIYNLSSLENFEFDYFIKGRLPRGIGKLCNLKKLKEFVVGKEEGWGIEELNGMNKLQGFLTISHLENVDSVEKARMASLKSKIYIDDLSFKWSSLDDAILGGVGLTTRDGEMEADVLEALEPYPTHLVALSLKNYHGERVPMWMANLRFPSLEKLILKGLQCVERVIMDVELPSLKFLWIENCPKLMVVSMGLPNLEDLRLSSCQELTTLCMIPSLQGFSYASEIRSLQEIFIINCPGLVAFLDKGLPPMLQRLEIASLKNLQHLLRDLRHSTSLTWLKIEDCPELVSFPEEGLPLMLKNLYIINCANLRHLPTGLRDLTSLKVLMLDGCPVLGIKSDDQLPPKLRPNIANCSKLRQQLKDEDRKDWL